MNSTDLEKIYENYPVTFQKLGYRTYLRYMALYGIFTLLVSFFVLGLEADVVPREETHNSIVRACNAKGSADVVTHTVNRVSCVKDMYGGKGSAGNWNISSQGFFIRIGSYIFYLMQKPVSLIALPLAPYWWPFLFSWIPSRASYKAEEEALIKFNKLVSEGSINPDEKEDINYNYENHKDIEETKALKIAFADRPMTLFFVRYFPPVFYLTLYPVAFWLILKEEAMKGFGLFIFLILLPVFLHLRDEGRLMEALKTVISLIFGLGILFSAAVAALLYLF